jgi:hypothetical protein
MLDENWISCTAGAVSFLQETTWMQITIRNKAFFILYKDIFF